SSMNCRWVNFRPAELIAAADQDSPGERLEQVRQLSERWSRWLARSGLFCHLSQPLPGLRRLKAYSCQQPEARPLKMWAPRSMLSELRSPKPHPSGDSGLECRNAPLG